MKTPHHMSWFYSCMWNLKCGFIKVNSHFGVWNFTCRDHNFKNKHNLHLVLLGKKNTAWLWLDEKCFTQVLAFFWRAPPVGTRWLWPASSSIQALRHAVFNWHFKREGFTPPCHYFILFLETQTPIWIFFYLFGSRTAFVKMSCGKKILKLLIKSRKSSEYTVV